MFLDEDQPIINSYADDRQLTTSNARQRLEDFEAECRNRRQQRLVEVIAEHGSGKIPADYHYRFQENDIDISLSESKDALHQLSEKGVIGRYYLDSTLSKGDQPYYTATVWDAVQEQDVEPYDKIMPMTHIDVTYNMLKRIANRTRMPLEAVLKESLRGRFVFAQEMGSLTR